MVRLLAIILFCFTPLIQAATLELKLDKTRLETGKFLLAKIIYRGTQTPGRIDLSQWQDDFFIDRNDAEISSSGDGLVEAEINVRLYPRHSGNLILEAIALGGAIARPAHVLVVDPVRNGIDATPKLRLKKNIYWADQPIDIEIEVPLHDARNNVVADDFELENFEVTRLTNRRIKTKRGVSVVLRWMILTARKGTYTLELPAIQQRGRGRFRFYLPPLSLRIKPLPAYLPPTVAVGKPAIETEVLQQRQHQAFLQINVSHHGRLPEQLAGFSELIETLGVAESAIEVTHENYDGIARRRYTIALPAWFLPQHVAFNLDYFDTDSGRLKTLHPQTPLLWQLPHYMLWLGILIVTILLFFALSQADKLAAGLRQRYRLRQQILQADDAQQLRHLLLNHSGEKTLFGWRKNQHKKQAEEIAEELNRACFARDHHILQDQLKRDCMKTV
jgi:hypothetical protein